MLKGSATRLGAPGPIGDDTPAAGSFTLIKIDATGKLYFDGGVDTYITEQAANQLWMYVAGASALVINEIRDVAVTNGNLSVKKLILHSKTAGITAHVGSSQGDGPLTTDVNEISVCANAGDAVTMPAASASFSAQIVIINNGAESCDVFPASGDDLGAGANTAVALAAGAKIKYTSYDETNWVVV